jgi:hypothetical protein
MIYNIVLYPGELMIISPLLTKAHFTFDSLRMGEEKTTLIIVKERVMGYASEALSNQNSISCRAATKELPIYNDISAQISSQTLG